ncbi:MAG: ATP synthase subunit I [Oligoflexia bacterium]|nr:ATP synthase subunit I [Oligoflexia bacterium]
MNETFTLIFAFVMGLLLGGIFFGGLWLTVKKGLSAKRPALWFFVGILLRMSIVLSGFYYFVSSGHWEQALVCLLGFMVIRLSVTWPNNSTMATSATTAKEISNAP